jgi:hypothetical protein
MQKATIQTKTKTKTKIKAKADAEAIRKVKTIIKKKGKSNNHTELMKS